jgi:hypothetical protein
MKERKEYVEKVLIPKAMGKSGKVRYFRILKGDASKLAEELVKREGMDPKWDPMFSNLIKSEGLKQEKPFKGGVNFRRATPEKIEKIKKHKAELDVLKKAKK